MLDLNASVGQAAMDTWARPIVVTPYASQPGVASYDARGVWVSQPIDVMTQEGAVFSDQRTIISIRVSEFTVPPMQGDHIYVPAHLTLQARGPFEVQDSDDLGQGRVKLTLRKVVYDEPRE